MDVWAPGSTITVHSDKFDWHEWLHAVKWHWFCCSHDLFHVLPPLTCHLVLFFVVICFFFKLHIWKKYWLDGDQVWHRILVQVIQAKHLQNYWHPQLGASGWRDKVTKYVEISWGLMGNSHRLGGKHEENTYGHGQRFCATPLFPSALALLLFTVNGAN